MSSTDSTGDMEQIPPFSEFDGDATEEKIQDDSERHPSVDEQLKQLRKQVQDLHSNAIFRSNINRELLESIEESSRDSKRSLKIKATHTILHGVDLLEDSKDGLELDFFSIMMLNKPFSWKKIRNFSLPIISCTWFFGFLSFIVQLTLGTLLLAEQMDTTMFETTMSIPSKSNFRIGVAQVLTILLSIMIQTDLLIGFRTILLIPLKDKARWEIFFGKQNKPNSSTWFWQICLPNLLKMIQGGMTLLATFVVIVQSENIISLLKDFSSLYVISTIDDLFYITADSGYFGMHLSAKADEVKEKKILQCTSQIKNHLISALAILITGMLGGWMFITRAQATGVYVSEKYPLCPFSETFDGRSYLSMVGDSTCQFQKGEGTNILNCGWDGGDCLVLNERYPNCTISDVSLLGDGNCDFDEYNTLECGYDNGDCLAINKKQQAKYPLCPIRPVENLHKIGDGFCNGGDYFSDECGHDGGDCYDCSAPNLYAIGNGVCDGGEYYTLECGFDGGDCDDCTAENPALIGNGICNGVSYNNAACAFDGGDCDNCIVPDQSLVGDGVCHGGIYNSPECGFDAGDCDSCTVPNLSWVGDGFCNGGAYYSENCGFDGGDCDDCKVDDISLVGNGFCDEGKLNKEECSFDGGDCIPSMELIGDIFGGRSKWSRAVLSTNGFVYGIPSKANKVIKLDTSDGRTTLIGQDLGNSSLKWKDGVELNGFIYGIPYLANSILKFDPYLESTSLIAEGHELLNSPWKFSGGVASENGFIYFIPFNHNKVVKFDPSNLTHPITEIGEDLGSNLWKFEGGVLGGDGNIYAIPFYATRVLKIDVSDDSTHFIGGVFGDDFKWMNGALAKDGNIYACPLDANYILQIDVENESTNLVGPNVGDGGAKWGSFVEGRDGFLYGIPYRSENMLRFDPMLKSATIIPLDKSIVQSDPFWKWSHGVRADNDHIYAFPYNKKQVLQIAPLSFRE